MWTLHKVIKLSEEAFLSPCNSSLSKNDKTQSLIQGFESLRLCPGNDHFIGSKRVEVQNIDNVIGLKLKNSSCSTYIFSHSVTNLLGYK